MDVCLCLCAVFVVPSSIAGQCHIPIYCPVGCNSTLHPRLLGNILDDDLHDRFSRLHSVKASLQQSAPHSRDFARDLAAIHRSNGLI